ncbi:MAG: hypothetical protein HZB61_09790 [Nitrospirae bacterium]|nr:hypothetical protein [Nitrospirota bacterium]
MILNFFTTSGLLLGITCSVLTGILLIYGRSKLHRLWTLFNILSAIWGFSIFNIGIAANENQALLAWKFANAGGGILAPLLLHIVYIFCGNQKRHLVVFAYIQVVVFIILDILNFATYRLRYLFDSFYYLEPTGIVLPLFLSFWAGIVSYGLYKLIEFYHRSKGFKRSQALYFLISMLFGFIGGGTHLLTVFVPLVFGINIYPFGQIGIAFYALIATYAILRYRLLDISLVFKKTAAYSLSAGLLTGLFVVLVLTATNLLAAFADVSSLKISIFASIVIALLFNPLRNRIQKLIDKMFYKKSYDYFATVRNVSHELATTFECKKIYDLVGGTIYSALGIKNLSILAAVHGGAYDVVYYSSPKKDKARKKPDLEKEEEIKINRYSGLVKFFRTSDDILIKEELAAYEKNHGIDVIERVRKDLDTLHGDAAVPVFVDHRLALLVILGTKLSGDMFTNEDIDLLKTISNQTAIALKNARLYQDKVNSARLASIGMMSATFAHEIRNPLTSLKTFAQLMPEKYNDTEFRDTFSKIVVGEIEKIDGLISDLLDFSSRKKSTRMNNFDLAELVDEVVEYVKGKLDFEKSKIVIEKNYNGNAINMSGDPVKLKQAFGNIILNGCQAMHGEGVLRVDIKNGSRFIDVTVEDTGEGIHSEDLPKIFDPFVTTKEMGVGLGLAISKRIVEDHNGKIHVKSQLAKGTAFTISLPVQNE